MRRAPSALVLLALAAAACAPRRTVAPRAVLSPDSAAVLERAVRMARPAYETQEEALRAGAYLAAPAPAPAPGPALAGTEVGAPIAAPEAPAGLLLGDARAGYVIQVAAYRDRPSAEAAARDAARRFPDLEVVVEEGGGYFRVALAGWRSAEEARLPLARVKESYPGAWVRGRAVP